MMSMTTGSPGTFTAKRSFSLVNVRHSWAKDVPSDSRKATTNETICLMSIQLPVSEVLGRRLLPIPVLHASVRRFQEAEKADGIAVSQRMASHLDRVADLDTLIPPTPALQPPQPFLAVADHFDIDPGMRDDHVHLGDRAFHVDVPLLVVSVRMVCPDGRQGPRHQADCR